MKSPLSHWCPNDSEPPSDMCEARGNRQFKCSSQHKPSNTQYMRSTNLTPTLAVPRPLHAVVAPLLTDTPVSSVRVLTARLPPLSTVASSVVASKPLSFHRRTSKSLTSDVRAESRASIIPASTVTAALAEVRSASGTVAIAAVDTDRHLITLSQFDDNRSYKTTLTALMQLQPHTVIIPDSAEGTPLLSAIRYVTSMMDDAVNIQQTRRKYYNDSAGLDVLQKQCTKESYANLNINQTHCLALSALAAVMKFVEHEEGFVARDGAMRCEYRSLQQFVSLDIHTAAMLELISSSKRHTHSVTTPAQQIVSAAKAKAKVARVSAATSAQQHRAPITRVCSESLFDILNHCRTTGGARLLRSSLLQPYRDTPTIMSRLNAVDQILANSETFFSIDALMKDFNGFESVITRTFARIQEYLTAAQSQSHIQQILLLKRAMDNLPALAILTETMCHTCADVRPISSPPTTSVLSLIPRGTDLLRNITDVISQSAGEQVRSYIDAYIEPSAMPPSVTEKTDAASARTRVVFAIREGLHPMLDTSRQVYYDTCADLQTEFTAIQQEFHDELVTQTGDGSLALKSMKLLYSTARGYHMQVHPTIVDAQTNFSRTGKQAARGYMTAESTGDRNSLNMNNSITTETASLSTIGIKRTRLLTQIVGRGRNRYATTETLISLNHRQIEAFNEVVRYTAEIIHRIVAAIHQHLHWLFAVGDALCLLDLLMSFVHTITLSSQAWCRPQLNESGPIIVKDGRHPLLEAVCIDTYVANDILLSPMNNCSIVSGSNHSGKASAHLITSCYLRQIGVILILAHIGCYVPATSACVRMTDHLLMLRQTNDRTDVDPIANDNGGAFYQEMKAAVFILQNSTERSLVLLDELGRSTSTEDGVSIAWAVIEDLLRRPQCYTVAATHFPQLNDLSRYYPNCNNLRLRIQTINDTGALTPQTDYLYKVEDGAFGQQSHYGIHIADICAFPVNILTNALNIARIIQARNNDVLPERDTASASEVSDIATVSQIRPRYRLLSDLMEIAYRSHHESISSQTYRTTFAALAQKYLVQTEM